MNHCHPTQVEGRSCLDVIKNGSDWNIVRQIMCLKMEKSCMATGAGVSASRWREACWRLDGGGGRSSLTTVTFAMAGRRSLLRNWPGYWWVRFLHKYCPLSLINIDHSGTMCLVRPKKKIQWHQTLGVFLNGLSDLFFMMFLFSLSNVGTLFSWLLILHRYLFISHMMTFLLCWKMFGKNNLIAWLKIQKKDFFLSTFIGMMKVHDISAV